MGRPTPADAGRAVPRPRRPSGPRGRADSLLWVVRNGLVNLGRGVEVEDPYLVVLHVGEGEAMVTDGGLVDLGNGLASQPQATPGAGRATPDLRVPRL